MFFIFCWLSVWRRDSKWSWNVPSLKSVVGLKKKSCLSFVNHRLSFVEEIMAMIYTGEEQPQPKFFLFFFSWWSLLCTFSSLLKRNLMHCSFCWHFAVFFPVLLVFWQFWCHFPERHHSCRGRLQQCMVEAIVCFRLDAASSAKVFFNQESVSRPWLLATYKLRYPEFIMRSLL